MEENYKLFSEALHSVFNKHGGMPNKGDLGSPWLFDIAQRYGYLPEVQGPNGIVISEDEVERFEADVWKICIEYRQNRKMTPKADNKTLALFDDEE